MDIHRLIDIWQVVLQEPRVAAKEANLILHSELNQQLVRDVLEKQNVDDKRTVQKSNASETEKRIVGKRKGKSSREKMPAKKRHKRQSKKAVYCHTNIMAKDRIDVII